MVATFVIYPLLTTAFYYLISQATITRWLWSRYPPKLDEFLQCSACSGTWYGAACAVLGWWQGWGFLGLPSNSILTVLVVAFGSMVWTPLLTSAHLHVLRS